jgi:hypothetical protein
MNYADFVRRKLSTVPATGITADVRLPASMFPHQLALTKWAIKRGRAAIFADTGLGKSRMQLAWADAVQRHTGKPVLILAPLAVAQQTVQEARSIGIEAAQARSHEQATDAGIVVTNYERLHRFDAGCFGGVVLDESSCIKHHDTKTLRTLLDAFKDTQFKLCATATPAPNDWTELGTHAEFLGVCTRQEMLAEYFCHDGGDTSVWRLKGHARHLFWAWVSTWGAMIRKPSDLGFDDSAYELPALHMHEHQVDYERPLDGMLFAAEAQSLSERRDARRSSLAERVASCVAVVNAERGVDGLEERVCGSAQSEGRSRPGIQGKEKCSIDSGQSGQSGIHEELREGEPGKEKNNARAESAKKCEAPGEVPRRLRISGQTQGHGEGVAGVESEGQEGAAIEAVRDRNIGLLRHAGDTERPMRDLRARGHDEPQLLSAGGSLPQDGACARASLHELQPGAWQVQGRRGSTICGDCLPEQAWLIWVELNDEQDALERAFGDRAFSVRGPMTPDAKEAAILGWVAGERPIMISKPSIMGWGINAQHAARMAFVGVTDSYEAFYQAVRRSWRFGQTRDVHVHVFASKAEGAVVSNLRRKERDAQAMAESLSAETRDAVMAEVTGLKRETNAYGASKRVTVPSFLEAA